MSDNNSMNSFLAAINSQKEVAQKLSVLESPAAKVFRSMREPFNERQRILGLLNGPGSVLGSLNGSNYANEVKLGLGSSAALASVKYSLSSGLSEYKSAVSVMADINNSHKELMGVYSKIESSISIAIKQSINQFNENRSAAQVLALGSSWRQHSAAYGMFHEQTVKLARIFDPDISDFIQNNIRAKFKKGDSVSAIETAYISSFEQVETDFDSKEMEEFSTELSKNPTWIKFIIDLSKSIKKAYLGDEFTDFISLKITQALNIKNPAIIGGLVMVVYLSIKEVKPLIDNCIEATEDKSRDDKLQMLQAEISQSKSDKGLDIKTKKAKESFFEALNSSLELFEKELLIKYKKRTVQKYTQIAAIYADYIYNHTDCVTIEDITRIDISDKFISAVRYDELNQFEIKEIQQKLKVYLEFLGTTL